MVAANMPGTRDEYAERYTGEESPVLAALNRETNIKRGDAVMLSGHMQGAFLQMISSMVKPKTILEINNFHAFYFVFALIGGKVRSFSSHYFPSCYTLFYIYVSMRIYRLFLLKF